MDKHKQPVKQAVDDYYADKSLSVEQLESLNSLQKNSIKARQENRSDTFVNYQFSLKKIKAIKWSAAMLATALFSVLIATITQTPMVVTAAYADISKDQNIHNGMQLSMTQWLNENNIAATTTPFPVEMSKFCLLDQYLSAHLRIAGVEQGKLHLFFHQGIRPIHWINRSGQMHKMNWRLVKLHNDLTVIVLYTHDMRESSVDKILREMLPQLQA